MPLRRNTVAGVETICIAVAALVDTNILVYRYDPRFPDRQKLATRILRRGIAEDSIRVPHQALLEFVAAVTRPLPGTGPLLAVPDALREAEEMLGQFPMLYPDAMVLRTALRGAVAYQLTWFDAHMWAYAEHFGLPELLSEDFQHDRLYGSVRAVNPFL
jgi:predicted nucleic acid-binding protein